MRHPDPERHRLLFRVGLVAVVASFPLGYGGIVFFGILAATSKCHSLLWGGAICYALSWVLMLFGFWLGGRPAYDYAKTFWHLRRRRKRYLHLRSVRAARRRTV